MNQLDKMFAVNPDSSGFAGKYLEYLNQILVRLDRNAISRFAEAVLDVREQGGQVLFIGNGGSAATADHFANDFCIGPRSWDKPIRALSLASNSALITCIGNDFGYDQVFVKQLQIHLQPHDLVVAISVSGNSPNVVEGIKYAKSRGVTTVGLTGFEGGALSTLADIEIRAFTNKGEYGPAEDVHMIMCHLITSYLTCYIQAEKVDRSAGKHAETAAGPTVIR